MTKAFAVLFLFCASVLFSETITFTADSMTGVAGDKTNKTSLLGHAYVKTASMEISADEITLDGDDFRFITALGSVSGKNTKSNMDFTCGKMTYDRTTEIARIEDSVHLVDNENDVSIDAQLIEYNQKTEIAVMQISVTLKQKNNTCTSAYAVYRKLAQMLEMSGNPKIVQGEDSFRAQEIVLNLDTQEITLDGRVSGTVTDSKKEKSQADGPGGEPAESSAEEALPPGKAPEGVAPDENAEAVAQEQPVSSTSSEE
ncbi:MAG: organic solvent tolerance protein OstA [Treponema sp.]|nr:organic solvent tolerance protein OstA [Treponema sp.]